MAKKYLDKHDRLENIIYSLEGSLEDAIGYLQNIRSEQYGQNYYSFYLQVNEDYDYTDLSLYGIRKETDSERNKRLKKQKNARLNQQKQKEKIELQEREMYEKLKRKFDGN